MTKTLIVADHPQLLNEVQDAEVLSFDQYLAQYPKVNEPKTRVINLCDTSQYLSRGYYCSLLAEARQHRVLPGLACINDIRNAEQVRNSLLINLSAEQSAKLTDELTLWVFFGWSSNEAFKRVSRQAFEQFPAPILRVTLRRDADGVAANVQSAALHDVPEQEQAAFVTRMQRFTRDVWRTSATKRKPRWELAILVNDDEPSPPSDADAIKRFIKAASKLGIHAETISHKEAGQIAEYDALFIRETTAIDHHTYRIARAAEQEGLVVIDDPTSILRCCNKVFLHDAFSYNKVPSLKTMVSIGADDPELDRLEQNFTYPMVLKLPEGSFSRGVFKVDDRAELRAKLLELLEVSALVLVQEFLYTEYDWRIGVLNGRAIYACRYHMARKHWQIYNHGSKRFSTGGFETLPTFEVPRQVLDAALKACAMIGKGLYGVDIKQKDNHVYVIEVNDNPSIDHGVEDKYLGNELYMLIMQEFANRLEMRGKAQ